METPIKMDDLGVPLFSETPICTYAISAMNHMLTKVHPHDPFSTPAARGRLFQFAVYVQVHLPIPGPPYMYV